MSMNVGFVYKPYLGGLVWVNNRMFLG